MGTFFKQISLSTFVAAFLVACGDDPVSELKELAQDELESSSSVKGAAKSSSSTADKKTSSSSSVDGKVSSSSLKEVGPEEGLDVVYALVDGKISGVVGLDSYTSAKKVKMVELDSADD